VQHSYYSLNQKSTRLAIIADIVTRYQLAVIFISLLATGGTCGWRSQNLPEPRRYTIWNVNRL